VIIKITSKFANCYNENKMKADNMPKRW